MLFNREQVMAFLPHRDPFLFIDSVESIDCGEREMIEGEVPISGKDLEGMWVNATFFTRPDLSIFAGHFPGNPILPGVVQVEMMGQAACFLVTKLFSNPSKINLQVALMGVSNAKFRKPITPNMHLKIRAKCVKARGTIMSYDCQIYHQDELMSEASILATVKL